MRNAQNTLFLESSQLNSGPTRLIDDLFVDLVENPHLKSASRITTMERDPSDASSTKSPKQQNDRI